MSPSEGHGHEGIAPRIGLLVILQHPTLTLPLALALTLALVLVAFVCQGVAIRRNQT